MAIVEVGEDLLPDRLDVVALAGRPFSLLVPVLDGSGPVAGADIASARAQVRQTVGGDQIFYTFSSENDPADLAISDAGLAFTASSDQTSDWARLWPGSAPRTVMWWDVEFTDADDITWQLTLPGTFTVVHQVTR